MDQLPDPSPDATLPPARSDAAGVPDARPSKARRRIGYRLSALVAALLVASLGFHTARDMTRARRSAREISVVQPPPKVVGLGYLEPSSTVVRIGAPGSPDAARVARLTVREGDQVEAGQLLAVLDTADRLATEVVSSEAQVRLKRLMLGRQKLDIAYTIASRRAALVRAAAEFRTLQAEYERQRSLAGANFASRSSFEKAERDYLNARATLQEMAAGLSRIEAKNPEDASGTLMDVAVAKQELVAAEADLGVARAGLSAAMIRAPFKGRVIALHAREGERIGSGGLLELGATDHMRAVVEVYQTDIGRVRVGEAVQLRGDAIPEPITGVVERIGAAIQRQTVVNNDPATATDARVVQVFAALDDATSRRVATLSRLQVTGVFQP